VGGALGGIACLAAATLILLTAVRVFRGGLLD
jgi:hypothetical protein